MSIEILYEAVSLIDDDLIDEAVSYIPRQKKVIHWKCWAALAACCALVVGMGGFALTQRGGLGGNTGASAGGGGADGSTFMSYAGPVFPLTTTDNAEGITVERDITLDFTPWIPTWVSNEEEAASRTDLTKEEQQAVLADYNEWYPDGGRYERSDDIIVSDSYLLTNSTGTDKTLSVLYPFVSSLLDLDERYPSLSVNGTDMEAELVVGPYSGGFQGVLGAEGESEELFNLDQLTGWEEYKALLSDGSYLEQALSEFPDLSGTNSVVYKLTDAWGDPESNDKPNPTLRVMFDLDYGSTTVLSYGFHGGSYDLDNGVMGLSFSIREPDEFNYGEPYYIIVVGDDVENMETQGYVTGGWDTTKELDDFGVTIERYETDLDAILREIVTLSWDDEIQYGASASSSNYIDFETYFGLYCDFLLAYGVLAEDGGIARYDNGWLDGLDVESVDRVCYLQAEITVPAGESVNLSAAMNKDASYDHYCAQTENQGVNGYDMVTRLGSTLTFTGLTASVDDHGQIEIVRQNFGFDLSEDIKTVSLDSCTEHYYLEVRRLPQSSEEP